MKFLVVDDSATMRRIVVNSLSRFGYSEFVEAADGAEALRRFDATVGCVITDWNMPVLNGLDLVRVLRGRPEGRTVPILMVSVRSVREDIVRAIRAGVNGYVMKPFTPQVLREKLESVLDAAAVG